MSVSVCLAVCCLSVWSVCMCVCLSGCLLSVHVLPNIMARYQWPLWFETFCSCHAAYILHSLSEAASRQLLHANVFKRLHSEPLCRATLRSSVGSDDSDDDEKLTKATPEKATPEKVNPEGSAASQNTYPSSSTVIFEEIIKQTRKTEKDNDTQEKK